ncbi:hypothetical protein BC332_30216 [Capsicum chinense]|nr:hypothetical protein BC332_30216 [Capsicum chinense]
MLLEPCGSSVQRIFKGVQYDRITAVWLDDANFFRTSTAAPTINDVLWTVTKDVTRYSSLLFMGNISLSVMLENLVDNVYTGYEGERILVPNSKQFGIAWEECYHTEEHVQSCHGNFRIISRVVDSLPFWIVDSNLHLWVDKQCTGDFEVQAKIIDSGTPDLEMEQPSSFEGLDRSCEVETKRKSQYYGWVKSSVGNLTTTVSRELKLKKKIKFYEKGNEKKVQVLIPSLTRDSPRALPTFSTVCLWCSWWMLLVVLLFMFFGGGIGALGIGISGIGDGLGGIGGGIGCGGGGPSVATGERSFGRY